jgi:hypothetical protein
LSQEKSLNSGIRYPLGYQGSRCAGHTAIYLGPCSLGNKKEECPFFGFLTRAILFPGVIAPVTSPIANIRRSSYEMLRSFIGRNT